MGMTMLGKGRKAISFSKNRSLFSSPGIVAGLRLGTTAAYSRKNTNIKSGR